MKLISVITPTYNEEGNVEEVYKRVKNVFRGQNTYRYEHIFIDNASTDSTQRILRKLAQEDPNVKVIFNTRNFGHIRSPHHALLQTSGDAVISIVADLQDPPELIPAFLESWEQGYKVVCGIKESSEEGILMSVLRKGYYRLVSSLADIDLLKNFTGFGLYDKDVINALRNINDPYPYFRGLIAELGHERATIKYHQPIRKKGITKNNFYALYDLAMLGITSHSKLPLRVATFLGFALSALSFFSAIAYLIAKLLFWDIFQAGIAPILIGTYTLLSVQLFFIGLLGEYLAVIHTQVLRRPLVVEKERINFENT